MFDQSYRKAIIKVLRYIEAHADENMSLQSLSKIASISQYHFHRIFTTYMGVSLGQYIKSKRLEKSLHQITHSDKKVIDIALSSGYESPAAFNKAFRKEVGKSPTELRKQMQNNKENYMSYFKNKAVPFIGFQELPITPILFVRKTGNYHVSAASAWDEMLSLLDKYEVSCKDGEFLGIAHDNPHADDIAEEDLRFDACVLKNNETKKLLDAGVLAGNVDGGRYAVFLHKGPFETLGDSYHYIYGQWMYNQDQKFRDAPTFVRYRNLSNFQNINPETMETEIFIPVK